jgi:hypothetical protein
MNTQPRDENNMIHLRANTHRVGVIALLSLLAVGLFACSDLGATPRSESEPVAASTPTTTEPAPTIPKDNEYVPRDGDIAFQVSPSAQSLAIQIATGAPWSHIGIIYINDGKPVVYEAARDVSILPLDLWAARGIDRKMVIKRLTDADTVLTPEAIQKLRDAGTPFDGLRYDRYFEWSDDRLYCSELVWKVYRRGLGIELGTAQKFSDFNLANPIVQAKIRERWPDGPPLDEPIVSPAAIFDSPRLVTVYEQ